MNNSNWNKILLFVHLHLSHLVREIMHIWCKDYCNLNYIWSCLSLEFIQVWVVLTAICVTTMFTNVYFQLIISSIEFKCQMFRKHKIKLSVRCFSNWNFNDYSQNFYNFDPQIEPTNLEQRNGIKFYEKFQVYKFRKVFHCLQNGQQFKKFWFNFQTFVYSMDEFYCIGMKDTGNDV